MKTIGGCGATEVICSILHNSHKVSGFCCITRTLIHVKTKVDYKLIKTFTKDMSMMTIHVQIFRIIKRCSEIRIQIHLRYYCCIEM